MYDDRLLVITTAGDWLKVCEAGHTFQLDPSLGANHDKTNMNDCPWETLGLLSFHRGP